MLIISILSCGGGVETSNHKTYFPKREVKVTQQIPKHNLWVFLLAGQSNMAGRAMVAPEDTVPIPGILSINRNSDLIQAKEPLHFYEPDMAGLDCGLSFGKQLRKYCSDSVYFLIIPASIGGSSIDQWLGDSLHRGVKLLSNFKEKAELGKKYGVIKAIIWQQGEEDADDQRSIHYYDRLGKTIKLLREAAGDTTLPVAIGEIGTFLDNSSYQKSINEQIARYTSKDSNTVAISSSTFGHIGDFVHFDAASQRKMGRMFADSLATRFLMVGQIK